MNIDDLTIAQVREVSAIVAGKGDNILSRYVGQYVIVRTRNEGINAGYVVAADDTGVVIRDARRIYYHRPAEKSESWYEGVANHGLSDDSKVSGVVAEKAIIEDYSLTLCTAKGRASIEAAKSHAQT